MTSVSVSTEEIVSSSIYFVGSVSAFPEPNDRTETFQIHFFVGLTSLQEKSLNMCMGQPVCHSQSDKICHNLLCMLLLLLASSAGKFRM